MCTCEEREILLHYYLSQEDIERVLKTIHWKNQITQLSVRSTSMLCAIKVWGHLLPMIML
jgi:hypothetical protein